MDLITLDFETYWADDYSLSNKDMTTESYVRDDRFHAHMLGIKVNNERAYVVLHDDIPRALSDLDLSNKAVIAFNAQFDGLILNERYNTIPGFWLDPYQMSYYYYPETYGLKRRTLKVLLEMRGLMPKGDDLGLSRGYRELPKWIENKIVAYCANDVETTYQLLNSFTAEGIMPELELDLIDATIRLFTEPRLHLNKGGLEKELADFREQRRAALAAFGFKDVEAALTILRKNENFAELLLAFGVTPEMKESKRIPGKMNYAFAKTDQFMQELLEHENERVAMLADIKLNANSSIVESRLQRMVEISERATMPVMLLYSKARTGRWGGSDKMNPQNFKKGSAMRSAIEAPPGMLLGTADSSNIEARTLATWAGQRDLVMDFGDGVDAYLKFAVEVFQKPLTKKGNPVERFVGKTCILGLGYGTGADKLQGTLAIGQNGISVNMEISQCVDIVKKYREINYRIVALWAAVKGALEGVMLYGGDPVVIGDMGIEVTFVQNGVILPSGRVLHYPNLRWEDTVDARGRPRRELLYGLGRYSKTRIYAQKLVENIVQALSRDVVAYQLLRVRPFVEKVVMFTHDEINFIEREDRAEEALQRVLREMAIPPQRWADQIPLAAEGGVAFNYTK